MTCIVGLIDKDGVAHLASDSLGSNSYTKSTYKNQKIFKKDKLLIGYTSSYRMGQLLEHQLNLPDRKVGQTLDNWMYVDFVNAIRKLLKDNGFLKVDSNKEEIGTFIVAGEGRLFIMQDDLAVLESDELFDACGSGEDHAKAAVYQLLKNTKLSPKQILEEAVNTASRYVTSVGGEVRYLKGKK